MHVHILFICTRKGRIENKSLSASQKWRYHTQQKKRSRREGGRRALWLVALDGKLVYKTNYMENVLIFINPRRSKQTTTASVDTRTQKFSGLFLKLTVWKAGT